MVDGQFVLFAGAVAATPEMASQGAADARALKDAMDPWNNGREYLNFAETDLVDPKNGYSTDAWEQLKAIRSVLDPDGVFVANHVVPRFYENGGTAA